MGIVNRNALVYTSLETEHLDRILEIEVEAYPEPWTIGMFMEEIRSPRSCFYTVFDDTTLVGYGGFWQVIDEAHITSVTVAQEHRGKGYGRDQIVHLLDEARKRGIVRATLEVRESNLPAKNMYTSIGFTQVGIRKGYYSKTGEDAMVMALDLG